MYADVAVKSPMLDHLKRLPFLIVDHLLFALALLFMGPYLDLCGLLLVKVNFSTLLSLLTTVKDELSAACG